MLSRKKTMLLFAVSLALVLVLSACKMVVHTTVNADGSGEMSLMIEFANSDMAAIVGLMGAGDIEEGEALDYMMESEGVETVEEFCEGMMDETGESLEGATTEANRTDEGLECIMTMPFANLEELIAEGDTEGLEVSIVDGTFTYKMSGADAGMDMEELSSYQSMLGFEFEMLWKVTAPGKVSSHNGTSIDGNTVTWDLIELAKGGDFTMELVSGTSGGGGGDSSTIIIIAVVVVVVLFLASRKKKPSEEV